MPIYEYQCSACGVTTETIAPSTQTEIDCPCGSGKAKRILSGFAVGGGGRPPCGDDTACGLGGDTARHSGAGHGAACACCCGTTKR